MRLSITDLESVFLLGRITELDEELPAGNVPTRASRATKARALALRRHTEQLHQLVWEALSRAGYDPETCTPPVPVIDKSGTFHAYLEWHPKHAKG